MMWCVWSGPDRARFRFSVSDNAEPVDEIEEYWNGRYLSAGEATWRTLGFHITQKEPGVTALPIHGPDSRRHRQYPTQRRTGEASASLLDRYFIRPVGTFVHDSITRDFDDLTYGEYWRMFRVTRYDPARTSHPNYFLERGSIPGQPSMHVVLRTELYRHVTRLHPARPSEGERFYLRRLLQHVPALSFADLRRVNGVPRATFQEAAIEAGLFSDQNEAEYTMHEAVAMLRTPRQLRFLFVDLLVNDCVPVPVHIWNTFREQLCLDYTLRLGPEVGENHSLLEIQRYLDEHGRSLAQYGLPEVHSLVAEVEHELVRWNSGADVLATRAAASLTILNEAQRQIFNLIVDAVHCQQPLRIFVDGKAGRSKKFLINTICEYIRSQGHIVLPTATAAFAAQLYPGGRTTHSAFKVCDGGFSVLFLPNFIEHLLCVQVPVNENNEFLISSISPEDSRAELLRRAAVIVWDEAPMANRAVLSCVEETLRLCMGNNLPFGGKVIILLGDFRQTCPVIRGGSRAQVVQASIRSSPLWNLFQVCRLTAPIRNAQDPEFADFVDAIGDGAGPEVSLSFLKTCTTMNQLIEFAFPDDILNFPEMCFSRAILAQTNVQINAYNEVIVNKLPGPSRFYLASDSLKEVEDTDLLTASPDGVLDWAATHMLPGLPAHRLTLKRGVVAHLMRNLSIDRGLVKNARLVIVDVGQRIVTTRLLRPSLEPGPVPSYLDAEPILIPRIPFHHILHSAYTLVRRQFPLAPAYGTTFNSCQGLTLDKVSVDLTSPVFSHGQLYTALSRIRHRDDAIVRLHTDEKVTLNVTYTEILV